MSTVQLLKGEGSLSQISSCIQDRGGKKIFLISGSHFEKGAADFVAFSVLPCSRYTKNGTNVNDEEVRLVWDLFQQSGANAIVAIGGGSVIDLAKMMVWQCLKLELPLPLLAAVPTTTGAGSEATQFAVLYENKKKSSISHPALLPSVVALDPLLVYSLTAYQAAVSGMDVLAQAVESYWSLASMPESKVMAAEAIALWRESFISGLDPTNKEARKQMQLAAFRAGQAINYTRTTGPHALSYYLTAMNQVPHGQAVALFLPVFFLYNEPGPELLSLLGVNTKETALHFIRDKMKEAGLAIRLGELGIRKEEIMDTLLEDVNAERFGNNPVPFNHQTLKALLLENL